MKDKSDSLKQKPQCLSLEHIRQQITALDAQLMQLLANRRELSRAVAINKQDALKPVRDHQRERELLNALLQKSSEYALDSYYVARLFNIIFEDSRSVQQAYLQAQVNPQFDNQQPKTIAVLGGPGSYSYLAASKHFSASENTYLGCENFEKVLKAVETDKADFALLPIENSTSGGITEVYDLLLESKAVVIGEENYPVKHSLVGAVGSKLADIQTVLAHPEANKQCRKSLHKLLLQNILPVSSTAEALNQLANDKSGQMAAVASRQSAEQFGLQVLVDNITDQRENTTRFLVIAKQAINVSTQVASKTSIVVSTGQQAGALAEVLQVFKQANIPLSKLESRPVYNRAWEQMFYVDLRGNLADEKFSTALHQAAKLCCFFKILGCYPAEDIEATKVSHTPLSAKQIPAGQKSVEQVAPELETLHGQASDCKTKKTK